MFQKRIGHLVTFNWHSVNLKKKTNDDEITQQIEKKISPGTQVVLLDEAGKSWDTKEWKTWIDKLENQSKEQICFVIGESHGFSEKILKKFPFHLSLSKLTFSHRLALLVLFEQIYRVYSWKSGSPYHHE